MGGGDLNLKKSFHPSLLKNQARRYEEEQKALAERKKTQQRIQEIKEERAKEEVQRQLELAGGRKRINRVDWMYQGPTNGTTGTTEEQEAFLLGKRSIEKVLIGTDNQKLGRDAGQDSFLSNSGNAAENPKDIAAKIREDPLLAIKMQEQRALQAIARREELEGKGKGKERERDHDRSDRYRHRNRRYQSRSRDSRESSPRRRDERRSDRDRDWRDRDRDKDDGRSSRRDGDRRNHGDRKDKDREWHHHRSDRRDGERHRDFDRRLDREDRGSRRERSPRR